MGITIMAYRRIRFLHDDRWCRQEGRVLLFGEGPNAGCYAAEGRRSFPHVSHRNHLSWCRRLHDVSARVPEAVGTAHALERAVASGCVGSMAVADIAAGLARHEASLFEELNAEAIEEEERESFRRSYAMWKEAFAHASEGDCLDSF